MMSAILLAPPETRVITLNRNDHCFCCNLNPSNREREMTILMKGERWQSEPLGDADGSPCAE